MPFLALKRTHPFVAARQKEGREKCIEATYPRRSETKQNLEIGERKKVKEKPEKERRRMCRKCKSKAKKLLIPLSQWMVIMTPCCVMHGAAACAQHISASLSC